MVMFYVSVLDQKYSFRKIRSKNSKFFVYGEACNLDSLDYVELYDDAHFFCFGPKISFLQKFVFVLLQVFV